MTKPIYRADHCGSLVRPQKLREARVEHVKGKLGNDQMRKIEDECITSAIKLQQDAGIEIYSDGEFRRDFWLSAVSDEFFEGMENRGIDYTRHPYLREKNIENPDIYVPPNPIVTGKLKRKKRITKN
ncbi:MAG TPA: hypothetical protein VM867_07130, partial [Xanthobacteraceae bacterium]|nr:hypothetical protein [Xanthobacteraceae bacterium]